MKRPIVLACLLLLATAAVAQEKPRIWVHAPAEDLLALYPEKGAGFLISLDEYHKLVDAAKANEAARREQPPLAARLVRGTVAARVDGDTLRLDATYVAVVQGDRPAEIPFHLEHVALERVAVEGGELAGGSLRFDKPGTYSVTAALSARLARKGEVRQAAFRLPPAAAHTVRVALPAEVAGEVGPIVRAFRSGADGGAVVGFPDERGVFRIWFAPRSPAVALEPIVSAAFRSLVEVDEARTLAGTQLDLEVLRAPIRSVDVLLPGGLTIRALQGKGVKSWRLVRGTSGLDRLEVRFVDPVEGKVSLQFEAELPRDELDRAAIPIPRVADAVRYHGTVGVRAGAEVRLTGIDAQGARRLDAPQRDNAVALYEVWSADARIDATVERIAARTRADTRALLAFREGGKSLRLAFAYRIARQPLFRIAPRLPAGWILRHVKLDGADAPHRYEDDGRLVLDFPTGLHPGVHLLDVLLDTDEVDWVPNTGAVTFEVAGIRSGLDDETGMLVVVSDPAFRVATTAVEGLQPVGIPEIVRAGFEASDAVLYGWRFDQPAYVVRFRLERHTPQIRATVIQRLLATERLLKVHASVLLDIQRTGVRELQVALPKGTGPLVDFRGPLIKEKRAPADGADPETWTLVFQTRVRGDYRLEILFDRKFEEDAWEATVPEIALPGVADRGYLVVHSAGTTAISVQRNGMREADVEELPEPPARPPLEVLAYAGHPFDVRIASTRHETEEVVQAIALSAHIYGVVSPEGRLRCRAEYRVRNNDQAFLSCVLPDGATLLGAIVDGKPIKPLVEKGVLKLAMPRSRNRETPFLVAIAYESEVDALATTGEITLDRPLLDIDVLKTRYNLHLPSGYEVTDHDGDLVPIDLRERESVLQSMMDAVPSPFTADAAGSPDDSYAEAPASGPVSAMRGDIEVAKKLKSKRVDRGLAGGEESGPEEDLEEMEVDGLTDAPFEAAESANEDKLAGNAKRRESRPARKPQAPRGPGNAVPPGAREPADTPAPVEKDAKLEGRGGRRFVAHGGKEGQPTPDPMAPAKEERARPERALLSLDIQFLRPDNLVRLDSLAPTGRVTLGYRKTEVYARRHFLGIVLGAAALLALMVRRLSLLRLLPAAVLAVVALHFAGLSFLPADFARGAAEAMVVVSTLALLLALGRRIGRVNWLRRRRRVVVPLLLLASFARAEEPDEILVPYRDDPSRIEQVFLPADVYHKLRDLAYPETAGRATVLASADYEATLAGEALTVVATYEIVKETDDAERIPLALNGVAVTRALLDEMNGADLGVATRGRPAPLAVEKGGYVLVLKGKGRYTLALTLRPELRADGDRRTFSFPVRPVANARLRLKHDRPGHDVKVVALGAEADGVHHVGPVGALAATWTPRTEGFRAAAAELRADTEMVIAVRDGFTAVGARIRYGISGGTVDRLRVRVGKDLTVRSVACADLAGWQVDGDGNLVVALAKPADKAFVLQLVAERAAATRARTEEAPVVAPLDVLRDAGVIALETLPDLKLEVLESQGLLRGSADQAPKELAAAADRGELNSVYRFAVRPFRLSWRVFLEETRLRAQTRIDLYLERDVAYADAAVTVEVERGPGPFSIPVTLPEGGYEVQTVQGPLRDWWVRDGVLTIDLARRQARAATYRVILRRGAETSAPLPAPALAVRGAARETGLLRLAVADGLELEARDSANLLPEDIAKVGSVRWGQLVRAYRYVSVPWRLVVATREEPREMDALVVSRVVPLADRIRVEALVNFHVRRGLVDRLSFVVPVANEADALVAAPDLREERSEAVEGGRRYTLQLRTPTRGSASATVTYHLPYGEPVRGVEPDGAERTRRFVAVEKVPDGQVRVTRTDNLDPGDFTDLPLVPPGASASTVAGIYVGSGGPFALGVDVQRHTFEEVAKAVVYRAAAQAVVERSGWTRVVVAYRVYNRSKQFLRVRLPGDARLYSVLVAGQGVRPLGEDGDLLVPLRKLALGATTFEVEVVYGYRGDAIDAERFAVRLPEVKDLAVRRTTLSLHVPDDFDYSFETDMEEVDEAHLAAGEADDIYQEIKELYDVAERGNALQARRALGNFQRLERQARRAIDEVRANTRDRQQLAQVEAQERKLRVLADTLTEQTDAQSQRFKDDGRFRNTVGYELNELRREVTQAQDWGANRAYLSKNKGAEGKQVVEFEKRQQQRKAGQEGAQQELQDALAPEPTPQTETGAAQFGARAEELGRRPAPDLARLPLAAGDALKDTTIVAGQTAQLDDVTAGLFFTDAEGDGEYRGRVENLFDQRLAAELSSAGYVQVTPQQLRTAKGRISIRVELPLEGRVYHFARLGADGGVAFDASGKDGRLFEGFLALIAAAAAGFVLVFRFRR